MAAQREILPRTPSEWARSARRHHVQNITVHEFPDPKSGSELKFPQFLTLRVLIKRKTMPKTNIIKDIVDTENLSKANDLLDVDAEWKSYLHSIAAKTITKESGLWAIVRSFQIKSNQPRAEPRAEPPPDGGLRRSARIQTRGTVPDTDTRDTRASSSQAPSVTGSDSSVEDPGPVQQADDEQTVNTALISFTVCLVLFYKDAQGDWSLHRRTFALRDAKTKAQSPNVYQSSVDGYYLVGSDVKAIVEVKPFPRLQKTNNQITMQEASEMVCWISECPPKPESRGGDGLYRRLLVSQDMGEIFLTVASFSDDYVKYAQRSVTLAEIMAKGEAGFLAMRREGPYKLRKENHMDMLGKRLLGFCFQGGLA
ncbi:hypothetical protein MY8738_006718 [Beauveria namnaoensis]